MREPEPFERPPRPKIDRPPGSYDAIKFDGPCGLAGCGFDRNHYHPRWWVEQKEPRIEIPISMADPGRVYDRGVKFTPPAGATVTHHDGPCGRKDCSHSVPHHHAEFENTSCIWFDKPNYEQSPISVRVEYDEKLFREGIFKIQNELRARRAQPEVRSTYRLPARISRRRRLIGWAMLAATAAGWIVRLLL